MVAVCDFIKVVSCSSGFLFPLAPRSALVLTGHATPANTTHFSRTHLEGVGRKNLFGGQGFIRCSKMSTRPACYAFKIVAGRVQDVRCLGWVPKWQQM